MDTIVTIEPVQLMFVAGDPSEAIPEQARKAFKDLESKLPSLKRRRFYGIIDGDAYRACAALTADDDIASLPHPTWTLAGGQYARRKIPDWERNRSLIGPTFSELMSRADFDGSRPCIEYYRSRDELFVMVPVH